MAKQPEAKVQFKVETEDFKKGMKQLSQENQKLYKEFKLQEEQMKNTASESEKLEAAINYLGQTKDNIRKKIELTSQQLEKAKKVYGENSNEANKLSNELLDLQIKEQKLENSIQQAREEIDKQGKEMSDTGSEADKLNTKLQNLGDTANNVGDKLTLGVSAPLAAIGGIAGKSAMDLDGATRLMIGTLGATGDEAKQLTQDLETLWYDGFGDNPEQIARAIMLVRTNIKGINEGKELQKITRDILLLANATDSDLGEATRGINQLMHNFGLTAKEALDLFLKGQQEGLNFSNEMFDNVAEYAPLFRDMKFSAEEYFTILANGAQNGAYNLDYVNDIMKEFNIRIQDGSKTTEEAFGSLSKETQKLFDAYKKGEATAEDLFRAVIPELEKMEDQVLANQIGVDLFGTKFEDMGATTVYTLDDINNAFADTTGAMDTFAKVQEESFGHKFQRTMRRLMQAVEPAGEELLELFNELIPHIEDASEWFVNLDDDTKKFLLTLAGAGIVSGPAIKTFGGLTNIIANLSSNFGKANEIAGNKKGFGGTLLNLIGRAGPVGLAIGAFSGLALAINALTEDKRKLNEVSLDTYNSMMNEHKNNSELIKQFDQLREKSKLTQDEFARYIDLQKELQQSTDPKVIQAIKDEMNQLLNKSGLTNKELETMVSLNGNLVEALPGATEEITEQGNKIAGTTSELQKYNEEVLKMATLELQQEFYDALENQKILAEDLLKAEREREQLLQKERDIAHYINTYTDEELATLKEQLETEMRSYKAQLMKRTLSAEEREEARKEYDTRREILKLIEGGKEGLGKQLLTTKQQITEQELQIQRIKEQQNQLDIVTQRLTEQFLIEAGITSEVARKAVQEGKAVDAIEKQIELLQEQKNQLYANTPVAQQNTEKFKEGVRAIDEQINRLKGAKSNIHGLIDSASKYNKELGEEIQKRIGVSINPSISEIENRLSRPISKPLKLNLQGGPYIAPAYASGTDFHPGGPAILAEEGPELYREGNRWSIAPVMGVYDLKRGADVFPADITRKILSGMIRLPAYASGVGLGRKLEPLTNTSDNLTALNQHNVLNQIQVVVEPSDVIMDGTKVGKVVWRPVKENMDRSSLRRSRVPKGRSI